ncbi:MAG TPA: LptA/OstA family protein, partial [Bryobacteraceae bacterium]|nr:LptA/OstA family protein [Bryobacteraceae bacterium]
VDKGPTRTLEYSADAMNLRFGPGHIVEHVNGSRNARLVSTAPTSQTTVNSDQIDLEFARTGDESMLTRARASGGASVQSTPLARAGVPPPDTRLLKSRSVLLHMRSGGEEIDRVEADSPGHVEFLPNRPENRKRTVDGNNMTMHYGAANQIRSFTATEVTTRTEPLEAKGRNPGAPALTSSKGMTAHFDEKTGALTLLEQWENFRYQEGERRARSERAEFRQPTEQILLTGTARIEDSTSSTDADRITLNQKSGDLEAVGNVASMRQPDAKKDAKGGMLSANAPVQARAARMTTTGDNSIIVYDGSALLWQGADRIQANTIRIDQKANSLWAQGSVQTRLLDKNAAQAAGPNTKARKREPAFTFGRAPEFEYDDKTRLAHYRGGATLTQGPTVVTARDIRAWLAPEGAASSLEKAFADGDVKIVQTAADRTRTGTSEHCEYYPLENKVLLSGGKPVFQDSVKGTTAGRRITFYSTEDRVEVEGEAQQPVETRILRRKKSGS